MAEDVLAIVLAAGKSTRMKSDTPKVLHPVCGQLMIELVLQAARDAGATRFVVVVGHQAENVKQSLSGHADIEFALQAEQHGTGHAVMMCEEQLTGHQGSVMILAGDTPLLQGASLKQLLDARREANAACVIGTAMTENNFGLGRIVRDGDDEFVCIVEQKDATPEQELIQEINTGCFAFDGPKLLASLKQLKPENSQAEYYLTDCPAILKDQGERIIASPSLTITEAMGVNTKVQLADVSRVIQQRIQEQHMVEGVSIVSPEQTWIDHQVTIGRETTIYPGTVITGKVTIGSHCKIGPHAVISGKQTIPDKNVIKPFEHKTA